MKNSIIVLASLTVALAACGKMDEVNGGEPALNEEKCELSVTLDGQLNMATKATAQTLAKESTIQNVQIFVFRGSSDANAGTLDACISEGFSTALNYDASSKAYSAASLTCTAGDREIWAIVNAKTDYTQDVSVLTKTALMAKTVLLNENGADKLLMTGSVSKTLTAGSQNVDLTVKRSVASVILESVKNDMSAKAYQQDGYFKLTDVYLTNVPAKIDLSSKYYDLWYAKLKKESDATKNALIYDAQAGTVLNFGKSDTTVHTFYSFPNTYKPVSSSTWSARATRLVLEAQYYDGSKWHTCYYPINLYNTTTSKGLERNKQYRVNLTIRRPGSSDPDKPVGLDTVTGSITVAAWETGDSYTETI